MPLSQTQIDYIVARTNERGAAFTPRTYHFLSTQTMNDDAWLDVIAAADDGSQAAGGISRGASKGWLNDDAAFRNTVEDCLTRAEKHLKSG